MASYSIEKEVKSYQTLGIDELFSFDGNKYKTISSLTRRGGVWCSAGQPSYSVDMEVYDQLLDGATVIKTSSIDTCRCYGRYPNQMPDGSATDLNYATTVFSDWTPSESNAAIAAWKAGTLDIKRIVTVVAATSNSGRGEPKFRADHYTDKITVKGTDTPFTNYAPEIVDFAVYRGNADKSANTESTTVWAKIKLNMKDSGAFDKSKLLVYYAEERDPSVKSTPIDIKDAFVQESSAHLNTEKIIQIKRPNGVWDTGSNWHFMLSFSAGEEVTISKVLAVTAAEVPIYIAENNKGVAIGQYSSATSNQPKFESRWPAYFYNKANASTGPVDMGIFRSSPDAGIEVTGTATVQRNYSSIANIQTGIVRDFKINPGKVMATAAINFLHPFAETPIVVVGFGPTSGNPTFGVCNCSVSWATSTQFAIRANYDASGDGERTLTMHWIAIGAPT